MSKEQKVIADQMRRELESKMKKDKAKLLSDTILSVRLMRLMKWTIKSKFNFT